MIVQFNKPVKSGATSSHKFHAGGFFRHFLDDLTIEIMLDGLSCPGSYYENGVAFSLIDEVRFYSNGVIIGKTNGQESFFHAHVKDRNVGEMQGKMTRNWRMMTQHEKQKFFVRICLNHEVRSVPLDSLTFEIDFADVSGLIFNDYDILGEKVSDKLLAFIHYNSHIHGQNYFSRSVGFSIEETNYLSLKAKNVKKLWILIDKPWTSESIVKFQTIEFSNSHSNTVEPTSCCTIDLLDRTELNLIFNKAKKVSIIYFEEDGCIFETKKICCPKQISDLEIFCQ